MSNLYVQRISEQAQLPKRATELSAGMDIRACFHEETVTVFGDDVSSFERSIISSLIIEPGERVMIPTGLRMAVDPGHCIKFYPRSGLSLKQGLTLINCVGIGDSEYRDEYFAILVNHSTTSQIIHNGDRICQIIVEKVIDSAVVELKKLPAARDSRNGGFGSTGVNS